MMVTLKDGVQKEYPEGTTVLGIAQDISEGLARVTVAALVDGELRDIRDEVGSGASVSLLTFEDPKGRQSYWHSSAHILAQAVKRLYPEALLAIGPAIEQGFYYDFDVEKPFTMEDLARIEEEVKRIIKEDLPIHRFTLTREEALERLAKDKEIYKEELVGELPSDAVISFYSQGEFVDLCAGPHVSSTGKIKAMKLLHAAGAYWRGSEKNPMLQRIYGVSYPKKGDLNAHLERLEEAKKRDHNKLGRELEYFTTVDVVGQGLPLLAPKGAKLFQILSRFVEDEEERRGYLHTRTPLMAKKELYLRSGHWQHYKDGMFIMGDEEKDGEVFALRPMTCPFQFQLYNAKLRSYRDLPIRYAETSSLFRNESSGEMHGLIRLRQFTISEGHLICTLEQVEEEFLGVLDLINYMMDSLGLREDIWYQFSKWDPNKKDKYIDAPQAWEFTQGKIKGILDTLELEYVEKDGEAAFYGPKLDIQCRNVYGKEDTIITVQLDFALPERFDMSYVDKDGEKKRPIVIHRTSIGCYERTMAMLIEKYAGALPLWLSPTQIKVLPIGERQMEYARELTSRLFDLNIRTEIDARNEKIGYKIREAQLQKVPYMVVLGDREVEEEKVAVRSRKEGDLGQMSVVDFLAKIQQEIQRKAL